MDISNEIFYEPHMGNEKGKRAEHLGENRMDNNMLYEPADIVIYIYGKGVVAKEKSVVAYQKSDGKIVAYGTAAYGMAGNRGEDIVVASPLRRGAVADFPVAMAFFSHLLIKVLGKKPILKPAVAVCASQGITLVEKKALEEALTGAGAGKVFITDAPAEEFMKEFPDKLSKEFRKIGIVIGIVKDEPERYIKEGLEGILEYAGQEHVSRDRVYELLRSMEESNG